MSDLEAFRRHKAIAEKNIGEQVNALLKQDELITEHCDACRELADLDDDAGRTAKLFLDLANLYSLCVEMGALQDCIDGELESEAFDNN